MLTGKHFTGSAKAGCHLVKDQKYTIFLRKFTDPPDIALRLVNHPRGPLHQGLHDKGRDPGVMLLKNGFQGLQSGISNLFAAEAAAVSLERGAIAVVRPGKEDL